ncbi:HNH endonuclease [Candidatus Aerophobetes bacterium]|nr:HNH endonuclease [Candidatus Aerophobetes bacterium]
MNNWNIPSWLEAEVRKRDTHCIYCGVKFDRNIKKHSATWEHIVNDAKIINRENIALCCCSCNASKGAKELSDWITSAYCKRKNITIENVAPIVKQALDNPPTRKE